MLSYLTKCTVVICRKGAIIWKEHIFALGKQRTMNCSESHPSLKENTFHNYSSSSTYSDSIAHEAEWAIDSESYLLGTSRRELNVCRTLFFI